MVEPLCGELVGVSSLGTSKYDGGPPLYCELLDGVKGRAISKERDCWAGPNGVC